MSIDTTVRPRYNRREGGINLTSAKITVANNTRISPEVEKALKQYCADTGRSKNDVTEDALRVYLIGKGYYKEDVNRNNS